MRAVGTPYRGAKLFFSLFALFLLVLALVSLPPRGRVLTVGVIAGSWWGVPEGDPYGRLDAAIARFEAAHPGVKVRYTQGIRKGDYAEWLAEQLLSGHAPDVFLVPEEDFPKYVALHALTPIAPLAVTDKDFSLEDFYASALAAGEQDGRLYALPIECVPRLFFVNRTLLAREGIPMPREDWTWQDFLDIARRVTRDTDGDGEVDQYGFYGYTWLDAAVTNGAEPFGLDGTAHLSDSSMEEAVRFSLRLRGTLLGHVPRAEDFDLGRVAFRPFDYATYRTYQPYPWRIKRFSSFAWEALPLPRGEGSYASPLTVLCAGIAETSDQKDLAFAFLKELAYGEETQRDILMHAPALPVRRSILQGATEEDMAALFGETTAYFPPERLDAILKAGRTEPRFSGYEEAMRLADQGMRSLLDSGTLTRNDLVRLQKVVTTLRTQQGTR